MAFFNVETYLTLIQIFCQFSDEPVPHVDLHLTDQQGGAVPCSSVLVGSGGEVLLLNYKRSSLQCREFLAFEWGCCVWAQRDGNSFAVVLVFWEMAGWRCYQEGWCLFPDAFMEFLTIV